jgi:hypothetical protein
MGVASFNGQLFASGGLLGRFIVKGLNIFKSRG